MLQTLPPNFDRDLVFLRQVLVLTIFVPKLSLLVFELFLSDQPEVVDSETFIVVLASGYLFFLDVSLEGTALHPHGFLVLFVVVVVDGVGPGESLLLRIQLLVATGGGSLVLGGHIFFTLL